MKKNNIWEIVIKRLNWKQTKIFIKMIRIKKKNEDWNWNSKNKKDNYALFIVGERKEWEKKNNHR
jgi:hypothetical protein